MITFYLFFQDAWEELKKIGQFFQVAIHFHPGHLQIKINDTSFCAPVGLLLTKLNHYFDIYIWIQICFLAIPSDTKNK